MARHRNETVAIGIVFDKICLVGLLPTNTLDRDALRICTRERSVEVMRKHTHTHTNTDKHMQCEL